MVRNVLYKDSCPYSPHRITLTFTRSHRSKFIINYIALVNKSGPNVLALIQFVELVCVNLKYIHHYVIIIVKLNTQMQRLFIKRWLNNNNNNDDDGREQRFACTVGVNRKILVFDFCNCVHITQYKTTTINKLLKHSHNIENNNINCNKNKQTNSLNSKTKQTMQSAASVFPKWCILSMSMVVNIEQH